MPAPHELCADPDTLQWALLLRDLGLDESTRKRALHHRALCFLEVKGDLHQGISLTVWARGEKQEGRRPRAAQVLRALRLVELAVMKRCLRSLVEFSAAFSTIKGDFSPHVTLEDGRPSMRKAAIVQSNVRPAPCGGCRGCRGSRHARRCAWRSSCLP